MHFDVCIRTEKIVIKLDSDKFLDKLLDPQYWTRPAHFGNAKIFFYSKNGLVLFNIAGLKACSNET